MAHFAKLGKGNKVVAIHVVSNDLATSEQSGIDFLNTLYNTRDVWKQTSFNGNIRKNYAAVGYTYDPTRDAFIPPKPFNSWILNETTCHWEAPIEKPTTYNLNLTDLDGNSYQDSYSWNETTKQWDVDNS
tara:strand:+ start:894 stop:1283 length:390 start_codon:yes stop_codon:yes gene_type:complete